MKSDLPPKKSSPGTRKLPTPLMIGKDPGLPQVKYASQTPPKQPTPRSPLPPAPAAGKPSPQNASKEVQLPKASEPSVRKEASRVKLPLANQLKKSADPSGAPIKKENACVKLPLSDQVRGTEEKDSPKTPSTEQSKLSDDPVSSKQPAALEPPTSPKKNPQASSASSPLTKPVGGPIAPIATRQPTVTPAPLAAEIPKAPTEVAADSPAEAPATPARLISLDALRGFDMFWIIGGAALLRAIANWSGSEEFLKHATEQTTHTPWIGFTAYDLIFPLFVFMSGVTIPFAITSKIANGTISKPRAYFRVIRRFILLTALGLSFNFLSFDPGQFRLPGVLQLIAGGYLIAAIIAIHRPARPQFIWALGILVGYWLALTFIPVPGGEAGQLTPSGNLAAYLDRLLPGKLYMGVFDPEGPVRFLPAAAMALLGSATGSLLKSQEKANHATAFKLLLAGAAALGLGWAWGMTFPIIKPLWTSSYVLFCTGCSLVLLFLFYLVIDVWKQRWLGYIWIPIGMNAITIYVLVRFVNFRTISENILGGYAGTLPDHPAEFTLALGTIIIEWILLFYLFRKKTFLRA